MRSRIWLLLLGLYLLALSACTSMPAANNSHSFYYCRKTYTYGTDHGVILNEDRYDLPIDLTVEALLQEYISGPKSKDMRSPFPAGTTVQHLAVAENKAEIQLSEEFSSLSNADLTLACACLTLTVADITDVQTVQISVTGSLLNNQASVTMSAGSLVFTESPDKDP